MKYILSLLLGATSAVWGMEDTAAEEPRKPLEERRIDVNRFAGTRVSYPTCLNTSAKDGYSLESTLSIRRNCLGGFVEKYNDEIDELYKSGLFEGKVTSYNDRVMTILNNIVGDGADKENQTNGIPIDFRRHQADFLNDLSDLKQLIKNKKSQQEQIKTLLDELEDPFYIVVWMINYYSKYQSEYLQRHR